MTKTPTHARLDELEHDPVAIEGHEHRLTQIDDLLASIPVKGLMQGLSVRLFAGKPPKKGPVPKYWVKAGNRRLATLRRLMAEGIAVDGVIVTAEYQVPIVLKDEDDAGAYESSRTENLMRLPESVVEEVRAFAKMSRTKTVKEIAAVFATTERRVTQRLALAGLHDDVLAALEKGKISIEAAQAFTVEPDPKKQAAYLKKAGSSSWELEPHRIKSAFTQKLVRGDSDIAKLITRKRYDAAGGKILGDAFDEKASYWISPDIIDKLLDDVWADKKAKWIEDGWGFVEPAESFGTNNWGQPKVFDFSKIEPMPKGYTAKQQQKLDALRKNVADLRTSYPSLSPDFDWDAWYDAHPGEGDEPEEPKVPIEASRAHSKATSDIAQIGRQQPRAFTAEQKAVAGVVYFLDGRREPIVGIVKPGTKVPRGLSGKGEAGPDGKPVEKTADLLDPGTTMAGELAAAMTKALQAKLAKAPELALQVLMASLHHEAFSQFDRSTPLRINAEVGAPAPDRKDGSLGAALTLMRGKSIDDLVTLLAPVVAMNTTVAIGHHVAGTGKEKLVAFVDPPTRPFFDPDGYFAGITKPLIQAAWRDMYSALEGKGNLADGKKGDMAKKAADAARATGWLPPQLRTPSYVGPEFITAAKAANGNAEQLQAAE